MEFEFSGEHLVGAEYEPLFDFFKTHKNGFKVHHGDFVSDEDGTGVVHIAPGFGEDDHELCKKNNVSVVCPVNEAGEFTSEVQSNEIDLVGKNVFDTNDDIIKYLKYNNRWIKTEQYEHNYPHCWRTDVKLIYKAISSWYVKVTDIKDRMVELNQQINWIPNHIKDGLFGKWLENARDWSISRNRFWGAPVPVWESSDPAYPRVDVYGSISELEKDFKTEYLKRDNSKKYIVNGEFKINDLHRPYIDELIRLNPDDPRIDVSHPDHENCSVMKRSEDVLDCWFESGSMPFASVHYPFENKERFHERFPADFIVEYVAQTRGWFYTLMVLGTALFDKPPFLNCICHGVILDEDGQKLSKRLRNYPDPKEIFEKYGSDAMRWMMLKSPVMHGNEMRIDKEGDSIKDIVRLVLNGIHNSYHFLKQYQEIDRISLKIINFSHNIMDSYILGKLKTMTQRYEKAMDAYDTPMACGLVEEFVDDLNNWYIRRSKPRFWKSQKDDDKSAAFNTLYTVLSHLSVVISPLLPFLSEEIYQNLVKLKNNS